MLKINEIIAGLFVLNFSLFLSCQAAEPGNNAWVIQNDLDQLGIKGKKPSLRDTETAKQIIKASHPQEHLKKEAKETLGQSQDEMRKYKSQLTELMELRGNSQNCGQCKSSLLSDKQSTIEKKETPVSQALIIFVSSSMPPASLKALFWQAQRAGIPLVFRGLIDNSFVKTKSFFEEQQINGEIDPNLFDEYHVSEVPTFVMREGKSFDLVQGNISLEDALTLFKNKGELKDKATHLLTTMKAAHS